MSDNRPTKPGDYVEIIEPSKPEFGIVGRVLEVKEDGYRVTFPELGHYHTRTFTKEEFIEKINFCPEC